MPHRWNEGVRSVRNGFVGGRCGGAAPAQGRAEGPTAHTTGVRGQWSGERVAIQLRLGSYPEPQNSNEIAHRVWLSSFRYPEEPRPPPSEVTRNGKLKTQMISHTLYACLPISKKLKYIRQHQDFDRASRMPYTS